MKIFVILITITFLIGCQKEVNKESKQKEVSQKEIVNSIALKQKNALDAMSIDVSYSEFFEALYFGRRNIVTKPGDLQGYLTVELWMNDDYFWHFPNEESRKWFIDFLKVSWDKFKEWETTAKEKNILDLDKKMLTDTHKYIVSKRVYNELLFTDQMTIYSRANLLGPIRKGGELRNSMIIEFNGTKDFNNIYLIQPTYGINIESEKVLNAIINTLKEDNIQDFIKKENDKSDLFK